MSGSLNKVMLIGNLGNDVKVHYFDSKNCVGRFSLATNETYTLKESNEKVTQTEWHRVITRNKLAELCEKYLSKGDMVYVEGKIKTRKWNDNGVDRYQTEILADTIQFLNTKNTGDQTDIQKHSESEDNTNSPHQASNNDESQDEKDGGFPF